MAPRKTRLELHHQDLAVSADVRTAKLSPEDVGDRPEVVRRDEQSGTRVVREIYDKASGEPLVQGFGYRWVNEHGEPVPEADVRLSALDDGTEKPFSKHDPTVGNERVLTADAWIPVASIDEYLVAGVYEVWGETEGDEARLFDLAEHIRDFDEAPVVPFLLQPSVYKTWGIITPFFDEETFSLIARLTDRKIEPEHRMAMPADAARPASTHRGEPPTREQEPPFE
jgi:hypothetical protein